MLRSLGGGWGGRVALSWNNGSGSGFVCRNMDSHFTNDDRCRYWLVVVVSFCDCEAVQALVPHPDKRVLFRKLN